MCVILPFARQRFTPMDMVAWKAILADRRRRGLWQKMERFSNRERDWILVWLPGLKDPSLRLERDAQGTYRLSFYDGKGWFQFRQGPEIIHCLAHVEATERLRQPIRKAD
jgi:hypothetical protein